MDYTGNTLYPVGLSDEGKTFYTYHFAKNGRNLNNYTHSYLLFCDEISAMERENPRQSLFLQLQQKPDRSPIENEVLAYLETLAKEWNAGNFEAVLTPGSPEVEAWLAARDDATQIHRFPR